MLKLVTISSFDNNVMFFFVHIFWMSYFNNIELFSSLDFIILHAFQSSFSWFLDKNILFFTMSRARAYMHIFCNLFPVFYQNFVCFEEKQIYDKDIVCTKYSNFYTQAYLMIGIETNVKLEHFCKIHYIVDFFREMPFIL